MPTRADHQTGRWTMSFMGWEPLPSGVNTLAESLTSQGIHTAAVVDTPYYLRDGMNYDRGFQSFFMERGQDTLWSLIPQPGYHHESQDIRATWRYEADRMAPRTFTTAIRWLERHYKDRFFLYIDTWDPHEPWDGPIPLHRTLLAGLRRGTGAPRLWKLARRFRIHQGATPKGPCHLLRRNHHGRYMAGFPAAGSVENMALMDKTAIIFTTDHGFYFGEHGGLFGKMTTENSPDGTLQPYGDRESKWTYSPLFEELVHLPLLIAAPGLIGRRVQRASPPPWTSCPASST